MHLISSLRLSAECIIFRLQLLCFVLLRNSSAVICTFSESVHCIFLVLLQNTTSRLPVMSGKRAHTSSTDGEQQQPAQVCFQSIQISLPRAFITHFHLWIILNVLNGKTSSIFYRRKCARQRQSRLRGSDPRLVSRPRDVQWQSKLLVSYIEI